MSGSKARFLAELAEHERMLALRDEPVAKGSGTIDPGVPVQNKFAMRNGKRVELDPKDWGKDTNPFRAKRAQLELKRQKAAGKDKLTLKRRAAADRDRYLSSPSGKQWSRNNAPGKAGKLTWGPEDGKANRAWRRSQGFGTPRPKPSTGFRGTGKPYALAKRHQDRNSRIGAGLAGAGTIVGGAGLVAGGVPFTPNTNMIAVRDLKAKGVRHAPKAAYHAAVGIPRGGIFGYRLGQHEHYVNRKLLASKPETPYLRGMQKGKVEAERKIMAGMQKARHISHGAVGLGAATALGGKYLMDRKKVSKRADNYRSDHASAYMLGSGATAAAVGHYVPKGLDHFARGYDHSSQNHLLEAQRRSKMPREFGGVVMKPGKQRPFGFSTPPTPTRRPEVSDAQLKSRGTANKIQGARRAEAVGYHRGLAANEAHFVDALNLNRKVFRYGLRAPGLVVGGLGGAGLLSAKARQEMKDKRRVSKRDFADRGKPLKTSISDSDAKRLVREHGLKGALPKTLSREQKMAAYEARYVSAGGHKAQKWNRRAVAAEDTRVASVGIGGAAAGAWALTHGKGKIAGALARKAPSLRHKAEMTAAAGAVGASGGELYGAHARKKRSSYASAPAGVAASALRRMQGYTPEAT